MALSREASSSKDWKRCSRHFFFYGIQHVTPTQCQQWTDNPSRLRSPIYFGIKCFRKRHWKNADWGSQWEKTHLHSFCHSFEPLKMHQGRQVSVKLKAKHSINLLTLKTLFLVVTKINVLWNMTIILRAKILSNKVNFRMVPYQNNLGHGKSKHVIRSDKTRA